MNCFNLMPTGKINWLDEGHKIFRDHDGDIVTSIHHQRSAKKDSHYSKRDKRPAKIGKGNDVCFKLF